LENSLEQRLTTEAQIGGDLNCLIKLFKIYQRTNKSMLLNKGGLFAQVTTVEDGIISIDVIDFFDVQYRIMNPMTKQTDGPLKMTKKTLLSDENCIGWRLRDLPDNTQDWLFMLKETFITTWENNGRPETITK